MVRRSAYGVTQVPRGSAGGDYRSARENAVSTRYIQRLPFPLFCPCLARATPALSTEPSSLSPAALALAGHALSAFEQVVGSTSGFRARPGQHAMAACVADTLAQADLGEHPNPTKAIAVIQAGTGVGKSAAYASTAIAMALERKTRVVISTATVALQEQLMTKDLPALARSMDKPFAFALAKGRGRYVCKLKLERLVGSGAAEDDMFDDELLKHKVS
ncbi:MAG: hypothetical protein RLZ68_1650, partial [Pseudomonadota bacterium]